MHRSVTCCSNIVTSPDKVLGGRKQIWSRTDSHGAAPKRPFTVHFTEHPKSRFPL